MQNTGETSDITAVQMLVIIVCVCVQRMRMMMGASGCLTLSTAISVLKYGGGKRERACVGVTHTHTLEPQLRHTDLSMSKNGTHGCCC